MGCSPACMRITSEFGYPNPNTEPDKHSPWILDELSLNAAEKDGLAKTFIALMSSQFSGCPLARGVVPCNPSSHDLELLTALELAGHPSPPQGSPPQLFEASVSRQAFSFAHCALIRSKVFLTMLTQHGGHPVSIDLSADETFRHLNKLCDPKDQFVWLDRRFGELFRLDLFATDSVSPTSSINLLLDSDDDDQHMSSSLDSGANQLTTSTPSPIDAATAALASESTENAAVRFISSDLLAALNKLTQGRGSDASHFDCLIKVAEGLPNTTPPAFRGKLSIRLLRSANDHLPFTTFSIESTDTFPTKKLATSDTVRLLQHVPRISQSNSLTSKQRSRIISCIVYPLSTLSFNHQRQLHRRTNSAICSIRLHSSVPSTHTSASLVRSSVPRIAPTCSSVALICSLNTSIAAAND